MMKLKKGKGLKIFLIFIGVLTFLPLIQNIFKPLIIKGLDGAFIEPEKPTFSIENWNTSKYQDDALLYIKYNTAFRPDFVRISNQLDYWFFDEINTILTLGKENYIFDPNYIISRKGEDYLDEEKRHKKIQTLSKVKSILDSLSIPILFCIAPNKANYYSSFLPSKTVKSANRNQTFYEQQFQREKLPYINFDRFFEEKQQQTEHCLMPKYGAHWSVYGAYIAGIELFKSIELLTNKKYVAIVEDSIAISSKARFTDDDYLASLNLIQKWKSPSMAYPYLSFEVVDKPNALIISDSFFWTFYDLNIVQNCFSPSSEMWYYNKTRFNSLKEKIGERDPYLSYNDIKERDIIIVVSSDPGLKDLGYGFLEQLVGLYEN
ncbi:MAG: hypothetical protein J5I47_08575 [Vicingus serpentipes]|nr:hypothetical protein [Vicingus serpentipes]